MNFLSRKAKETLLDYKTKTKGRVFDSSLGISFALYKLRLS